MYPLFLLALFVAGGGITVLQVAANPYISVLGPEESASARLNLSQAFNSFGTTIAPVVAASVLLGDQILSSDDIQALSETKRLAYYAQEASAVQVPFVLISLAFFALAGVVAVISLPKILGEGQASIEASYGGVLRNKKLLFGALGIFVYVGAEVALGSYMVDYGLSLDIVEEKNKPFARRHGGSCGIHQGGCVWPRCQRYPWCAPDLLLGGAMVGRFAGLCSCNGWPSPCLLEPPRWRSPSLACPSRVWGFHPCCFCWQSVSAKHHVFPLRVY